MSANQTYEIKLPQFEGPFDLLLFFIERDELDVYDIPIAGITDDFLAYIRQMKALNIDLASEFILVAATLMRIKARLLIPRVELDEDGNEIDPRQDLVQALLEYKRFKSVIGQLQTLEEQRLLMHKREPNSSEMRRISDAFATETDLSNLSLYKLMKVFEKVMTRLEGRDEEVHHEVSPYPYTVEKCKEYLADRLKSRTKVPFSDVFEGATDGIHAVFIFLAVLDMVQQQKLDIRIGEGVNNFWLSPGEMPMKAVSKPIPA